MTAPGVGTIADQRLLSQGITGAGRRSPAAGVTWLGAVQAQEYAAGSGGKLGMRAERRGVEGVDVAAGGRPS